MPQLDAITFSTQIFWLLILFVSFYFFVLKNILPNILLNLKVRQTTLNKLENNNTSLTTEVTLINNQVNKVNLNLSNSLNNYLENLNKLFLDHVNYLTSVINNNKELNKNFTEIFIRQKLLKNNE